MHGLIDPDFLERKSPVLGVCLVGIEPRRSVIDHLRPTNQATHVGDPVVSGTMMVSGGAYDAWQSFMPRHNHDTNATGLFGEMIGAAATRRDEEVSDHVRDTFEFSKLEQVDRVGHGPYVNELETGGR
jgi:hypothetical protein